ncbi:MAG TPA: flagellar hook-basal body complex protein FliE [Candidatus Gastranaerophilales bacterium]|nr:flagellar hook-basal body complex protein FliE [Candidatus Gastranaerophilales bacterium]
MVDIMAGLGNLNNLGGKVNLSSFNQGLSDYTNLTKLDDFLSTFEGEDSDMLKGMVSKMQSGQGIDPADFESLSDESAEFAKDLQSVINQPGQTPSSIEGSSGAKNVADQFSSLMDNYLTDVNTTNKKAEDAVETFASGGDIDLHTVMIAAEKAHLQMQLTMQLRNKIMQAYKEVQNIHV